MFKPLYAFIGYRYSRVKRKNHFISFISMTSMIGIALGVTVLITVLSVMNGFSREIRAQMLSIAPHLTVKANSIGFNKWHAVLDKLKSYPEVVGAAPFIAEQGMLTNNGIVRGVVVMGVMPEEINNVFPLEQNIIDGNLTQLEKERFGVVLGKDLAFNMGLGVGDKVTLLIPEANVSPVGVIPRLKRFDIVGIYDTGTNYDYHNIFIHMRDANILYRLDNHISGIQLKLKDELIARKLAATIAKDLDYKYHVSDWTHEYETFFKAIKMEKTVMWCILFLIIAVAAFNLVSSLVMMVTDKRSDIAILRAMGAGKKTVMGIFMVQGAIIGTIGTILGLILGILLAYNVTEIVEFIQRIFKTQFISPDVYFIGFVPSEIHAIDVIVICIFSLLMSFVATIYPALRASGIQPAEALRYE